MFGSTILDVAIALALVYSMLSLIASALRETIEGWTKSRSVHLERGIHELLASRPAARQAAAAGKASASHQQADPLVAALYSHPLVSALYAGSYDEARRPRYFKSKLPSYIPSKNFATALLDIVCRGRDVTNAVAASPLASSLSLEQIRNSVASIQNPPVQRAILTAIDTAEGDLTRARDNLEKWYDSTMDRVSGRYKRRTQWILLLIGFVTAVACNVDTVVLTNYLYRNEAARQALTAAAGAAIQKVPQGATDSVRDVALRGVGAQLSELKLPIGWSDTTRELAFGVGKKVDHGRAGFAINLILLPIVGWLVTGLAVSLGAPFWFDVLNRIMVIRSTVKPHEKSPEEPSQGPKLTARETQPKAESGRGQGTETGSVPPVAFVQQWAVGQPDAGDL